MNILDFLESSVDLDIRKITLDDLFRRDIDNELKSGIASCDSNIKPHIYYRMRNKMKYKQHKLMRVFIGAVRGHQVEPFQTSLSEIDQRLLEGVRIEYINMDEIKVRLRNMILKLLILLLTNVIVIDIYI